MVIDNIMDIIRRAGDGRDRRGQKEGQIRGDLTWCGEQYNKYTDDASWNSTFETYIIFNQSHSNKLNKK